MPDLVVTVPKTLWSAWIAEGDAAGDPPTGEEWAFFMGGNRPPIEPGERLYIVAHDRLRGYAPVTRVMSTTTGYGICRRGGAVAVTIPETIRGFRGWTYRWWDTAAEVPFPDWKTAGVLPWLTRKQVRALEAVEAAGLGGLSHTPATDVHAATWRSLHRSGLLEPVTNGARTLDRLTTKGREALARARGRL